MAFLDTLLVDGHDLRSLPGLRIGNGYIDLMAPGERRGGSDVVYGLDGELGAPLPLAKYVVRVPVRITGATRGERNDNLRALGPLICGIANGGLVTLTRRIATGSGDAFVEHTARGQYITGIAAEILNSTSGKTELQYYNLAGYWRDGTTRYVP